MIEERFQVPVKEAIEVFERLKRGEITVNRFDPYVASACWSTSSHYVFTTSDGWKIEVFFDRSQMPEDWDHIQTITAPDGRVSDYPNVPEFAYENGGTFNLDAYLYLFGCGPAPIQPTRWERVRSAWSKKWQRFTGWWKSQVWWRLFPSRRPRSVYYLQARLRSQSFARTIMKPGCDSAAYVQHLCPFCKSDPHKPDCRPTPGAFDTVTGDNP